jgi:putative transposase
MWNRTCLPIRSPTSLFRIHCEHVPPELQGGFTGRTGTMVGLMPVAFSISFAASTSRFGNVPSFRRTIHLNNLAIWFSILINLRCVGASGTLLPTWRIDLDFSFTAYSVGDFGDFGDGEKWHEVRNRGKRPLYQQMARFARAVAVGCAHHITQRGIDRQRVFFTDADRRTYLDLLGAYARQARLRVLAYCLMDNHIHLLAVPDEPASLAVALRRAHGRYALYLNARRRRTGHLWQNRFYSCALDERHLWIALRYVERNPVRASLVTRAEKYEWSSAAAHLGLTPANELLDGAFHQQAGGAPRWAGLLAEP